MDEQTLAHEEGAFYSLGYHEIPAPISVFLSLHLLISIFKMYRLFQKICQYYHHVVNRTGAINPSILTLDRLVAYGGVGYAVWYDIFFSSTWAMALIYLSKLICTLQCSSIDFNAHLHA